MLESWWQANEASVIFAAGVVVGALAGLLSGWFIGSRGNCPCVRGGHHIDCVRAK